MDPTKDMRIKVGFYGVSPEPGGRLGLGNGAGLPRRHRSLESRLGPRAALRSRKSTKCPGTIRKPPCRVSHRAEWTSTRDGVVWTVLASGHFASFDRRKCKGPLNGPTATGQQCPEGWTLYRTPGPSFQGVSGLRQRRHELLQLGRSIRYARHGQEHSDRHRATTMTRSKLSIPRPANSS